MKVIAVVCLVLGACLVKDSWSLPAGRCLYEDDECREQQMHPDMPASRIRKLNGEETQQYWLQKGLNDVDEKLQMKYNRNVAKNVVMFVGDGMSFTTIAATRIYLGGEEQQMAFEEFTDTGLIRTYAVDRLVPDSASTATAFLSGVKSNYGTLGVSGEVRRGDCQASKDSSKYVESLAKWALDAGKSVGLVTTTRVTHATPAALYAHSADRDWENDKDVNDACGKKSGVKDIALQLLEGEVGSKLSVVFGGGRKHFIDRDLSEEGKRRDGRNLIEEFKSQNAGNVYIDSRDDLLNLQASKVNRVLGLFNENHMLFHMEDPNGREQPSLEEMTAKALEILEKNPNGYLLFVEGGKIDLAHHKNRAKLAIDETAELNKAVDYVKRMTSHKETLTVVTADHSHTLTISGYAARSNDIFGVGPYNAVDEIPYMTLSYANGPSFNKFFSNTRLDPTLQLMNDFKDVFPSTVPLESETHDAEDVPLYANGPWSDLFSGVYEQSTVAHLIGYASCLGHGSTACK